MAETAVELLRTIDLFDVDVCGEMIFCQAISTAAKVGAMTRAAAPNNLG